MLNSNRTRPGQATDATGWAIADRRDNSILSVILLELLALRGEVAALPGRLPVRSPNPPSGDSTSDRVVALLLAACEESGGLWLRDLYVEVAMLAAGKEFTSAEVVAHAALPANHRLRRAMEATLGADYSAGKVGKLFAAHADAAIAGIRIRPIGQEANAILWSCQSQTECIAGAASDNMVASSSLEEERNAC